MWLFMVLQWVVCEDARERAPYGGSYSLLESTLDIGIAACLHPEGYIAIN